MGLKFDLRKFPLILSQSASESMLATEKLDSNSVKNQLGQNPPSQNPPGQSPHF